MLMHAQLTELERFLVTVPDDTVDAPWMVMSDLQSRDTDLLVDILRLYVEEEAMPSIWPHFSRSPCQGRTARASSSRRPTCS